VRYLLPGILLALPALAAAELSTGQRLDLLERRANQITELTRQIDELRRENRQLRGETERLGYEIEQLKRSQRDIYLDIDQRLGALDGEAVEPVGRPPADVGGAAAVASAGPTASPADRAAIQTEYQAAYALLDPKTARYADAAAAFEAFLARHPDDPLADNAQYWLGEAHYVSQNNRAARAAFEAVVERYPESAKVPGALFKIGRIQQAGGDRAGARATYQRVVDEFPESSAAGLARQFLDRLGG
jgi:tol-pal system protein YbgF